MSKKIEVNEDELRAKLDPLSYDVLRNGATERPFTGEYTDSETVGIYRCTSGKWIEFGVSSKAKASFLGDAIRLWNKAPEKLKVAKTINGAKKDIKKFCMTLPV